MRRASCSGRGFRAAARDGHGRGSTPLPGRAARGRRSRADDERNRFGAAVLLHARARPGRLASSRCGCWASSSHHLFPIRLALWTILPRAYELSSAHPSKRIRTASRVPEFLRSLDRETVIALGQSDARIRKISRHLPRGPLNLSPSDCSLLLLSQAKHICGNCADLIL